MFANDAQALYRLAQAGTGLAIVPEFLVAVDITKKTWQ
jgi:DNA-binding transcriptional LysR family regulator